MVGDFDQQKRSKEAVHEGVREGVPLRVRKPLAFTRVGAANEGPLATVRVLQSRGNALEEERGRLVSAIAMGKGAAKTLVHELEKREKELEDARARIADAEERVLPVLVPSIARVKDLSPAMPRS